jgi:hypothetical protein
VQLDGVECLGRVSIVRDCDIQEHLELLMFQGEDRARVGAFKCLPDIEGADRADHGGRNHGGGLFEDLSGAGGRDRDALIIIGIGGRAWGAGCKLLFPVFDYEGGLDSLNPLLNGGGTLESDGPNGPGVVLDPVLVFVVRRVSGHRVPCAVGLEVSLHLALPDCEVGAIEDSGDGIEEGGQHG